MSSVLVAYIGPETAMPLLSAIAAVAGAILMFGNTILRYLFRKTFRLITFGRYAPEASQESQSTKEGTS
jgi:hypothetical protein